MPTFVCGQQIFYQPLSLLCHKLFMLPNEQWKCSTPVWGPWHIYFSIFLGLTASYRTSCRARLYMHQLSIPPKCIGHHYILVHPYIHSPSVTLSPRSRKHTSRPIEQNSNRSEGIVTSSGNCKSLFQNLRNFSYRSVCVQTGLQVPQQESASTLAGIPCCCVKSQGIHSF